MNLKNVLRNARSDDDVVCCIDLPMKCVSQLTAGSSARWRTAMPPLRRKSGQSSTIRCIVWSLPQSQSGDETYRLLRHGPRVSAEPVQEAPLTAREVHSHSIPVRDVCLVPPSRAPQVFCSHRAVRDIGPDWMQAVTEHWVNSYRELNS